MLREGGIAEFNARTKMVPHPRSRPKQLSFLVSPQKRLFEKKNGEEGGKKLNE